MVCILYFSFIKNPEMPLKLEKEKIFGSLSGINKTLKKLNCSGVFSML
jgi:hypothetical protein